MISGLIAFFFAKSGEKNKVSGIGWVMAALLLFAGLFGVYVIREKSIATAAAETATADARKLARIETEKSVMVAAKSSAMIMTLIGDFDLKQNISDATLLFEFDNSADGDVTAPAPGFVGFLPQLPDGKKGELDVMLGDAYANFVFETHSPGLLLLTDVPGSGRYLMRTGRMERMDRGQQSTEEDGREAGWAAQQEPAPGGFVYALHFPVGAPLRRLVYNVTSQEALGHIKFRRGELSQAQLSAMEEGFSRHPPMLIFYIAETKSSEACDSYVHVPLQIRRRAQPLQWDDAQYDAFDISLTQKGFVADPCNNNPF